MLYIISQQSDKYSVTIKAILENKLNEFAYEVLDPKIHNLDRSFSNVLILGELPASLKINANKIWKAKAPDSTMTPDDKKIVFAIFKEAVEYNRNNALKKEVLAVDIPRFADLEEFLHGFKGQVMQLKLNDGRLIGIYPDGEKLQSKYSNEYHVSTILNLARLQDVLGYTKLSVKDL